jgi:hypothetical protein
MRRLLRPGDRDPHHAQDGVTQGLGVRRVLVLVHGVEFVKKLDDDRVRLRVDVHIAHGTGHPPAVPEPPGGCIHIMQLWDVLHIFIFCRPMGKSFVIFHESENVKNVPRSRPAFTFTHTLK